MAGPPWVARDLCEENGSTKFPDSLLSFPVQQSSGKMRHWASQGFLPNCRKPGRATGSRSVENLLLLPEMEHRTKETNLYLNLIRFFFSKMNTVLFR